MPAERSATENTQGAGRAPSSPDLCRYASLAPTLVWLLFYLVALEHNSGLSLSGSLQKSLPEAAGFGLQLSPGLAGKDAFCSGWGTKLEVIEAV